MNAKLVMEAGQNPGAEYHLLTDRTTVGRSEHADIVVIDRAVSRTHIEIYRDGVGFSVRDLNSGNGTFLNGSRIREAELVDGDRIEVGSHTLGYRESPPLRTAQQRQVVYQLDEGGPAPQPPAPEPTPPPPAPAAPKQLRIDVPARQVVPAPAAMAPAKRSSGLVVGLVLVFSLAFLVLAGVIGYKLYQQHATAEPSPQAIAAQHIERGQAALSAMAWEEARDNFNAALQADPENEVATQGLAVASTELRQAGLLEEAERLISSGEYVQAIVNLRTVASESQHLGGAAEGRLNRLYDQLVAEGRNAIDRGDAEVADAFASVVLNANADHGSALALRNEIQLVRAQQQAQVTVAAGGPPPEVEAPADDDSDDGSSSRREHRSEREHEEQAREESHEREEQEREEPRERRHSSRSSEGSESDLDRGWGYYSNGDFDRAADFFETYANSHSGDVADQATDFAERVRSFADAFTSGRDAYNEDDYAVAVHDLRRAYSLDRRLQEAYRDQISTWLADSYYHQAQAAYDGGDFRTAGENARIALRYDDHHDDTLSLVRRIEERANELYIEAVSYRESNPDRARQICRDIENMLPESSDLRRRASRLRSEL